MNGMPTMTEPRKPRPKPKVMTLTDEAARRLKAMLAERPGETAGLRVGVKNGGCAGMEYTMEWADKADALDERLDDKGVTLLIDKKAVLFLLGTVMDYKVETLKSGFVFENPNQTSACGCGESVAITPRPAEELAG
jgi:iron-sulfur cluster assembly protein